MKKTDCFDDFYNMVVAAVQEIPCGFVSSYGCIAKMIGYPKNARMVGKVMSRVRENGIPCHRVVNSRGELAPSYIFMGRQRQILEKEGITFLADGRINMKKHLYIG